VVETTGGFTSEGLALEERTLMLPSLSQAEAVEIDKSILWVALLWINLPSPSNANSNILSSSDNTVDASFIFFTKNLASISCNLEDDLEDDLEDELVLVFVSVLVFVVVIS
jgi:hypothetical protein